MDGAGVAVDYGASGGSVIRMVRESATRAIRASGHPEGKAIPVTANAFVDGVRAAIESGMNAHVAKPIQVDKWKEAIAQVLDDGQSDTDERSSKEP